MTARLARLLRPLALGGALAATPMLTSCVTTKKEGEAMRTDIAQLKARLDEADRREADAKVQMVRLKEVLEEATALLTRNSADVGAKVSKAEQDLAIVNGRIEELDHTLNELHAQAGNDHARLEALAQTQEQLRTTQQKVVEKVAPTIPEDKDQLWAAAKEKLDGGYWDDARRFYRSFVQRFPKDGHAPQALLYVGQAYVSERKYPLAAGEFQKVLDAYPKASEVAEAMWQLALAFQEMKFCGDAKTLLGDLQKRYPRSPRAKEAKAKVKELERLAKDKTKCTS